MVKNYYIALIMLLVAFGFASCSVETDEEPGGTAVEKMAGTWTVTFQQSVAEYNYLYEGGADPGLASMTPDQLDKQEWEDIEESGKLTVMTSNTAANVPTEMWLVDSAYQGSSSAPVKVRCTVDYNARTFSAAAQEQTDGSTVDVVGGKVLEGAATTPRGVKADSIVAYVKYSAQPNKFTYIKMSGYRYTGYAADR